MNANIVKTNAAEHYERTKFDLYKDDICLVLTLTYVIMDNFLSLFCIKVVLNLINLSTNTLLNPAFHYER